MTAILEAESNLSERYQTTVPEMIRRALRLDKYDKIRFTIRPDGDVVLTRAMSTTGEDPVLGEFLNFLTRDLVAHPERLATLDAGLLQRIQSLVGTVAVDLETALSAADE